VILQDLATRIVESQHGNRAYAASQWSDAAIDALFMDQG